MGRSSILVKMTEFKPKTNPNCQYNKKGICMKAKIRCNNPSNFYEECNVFIGNRTLTVFC